MCACLSEDNNQYYKPSPHTEGGCTAVCRRTRPHETQPNARDMEPTLGMVRLDCDYPPSRGEVDHPSSFDYKVLYRVVPGLTFDVCVRGAMSPVVQQELINAIEYLRDRGVAGITSDCGFMMHYQRLARRATKLPVFMSPLAQLPAIICGFDGSDGIAIFTASAKWLEQMRVLIGESYGVDIAASRFVVVGCEDVPGFAGVAMGQKVNKAAVTLTMVVKAQHMLANHPRVRAILMECTEMQSYSGALREATGLPVYDAITCANFFISGRQGSMQGSPDTSMSGAQHGVQEHGHFSQLELASAGHTNLFNPSRQVYVDHLRPLPGTRPPAPCQAEQAQLARQSAQHEPTASVDYEMQACRRQIDANLDEIQRLQRALSDAGIEQPGGSANGYACEVSGMTQGGMTISQAAAPPQAGFARRPLQLGAQQYPREVQQSPMRPPDWWETHWQVRRRGTANLESPTQPKPKTQP